MTEEKQSSGKSGETSGCPICRCLWPSSTAGKVIALVVLLLVLGAALWLGLFRTGVEDLIAEGIRLHDEGNLDEAERVFEEAVRRDPKKPIALDYLGLIAFKKGDVDKAIGYRKKAIEIDPNTPHHYMNLAQLYFFSKKDYAAAEKAILPSLKLGPRAQNYLVYALCAVELKRSRNVIVRRLKNVIDTASAQVNSLRADQLAPDDSFAKWWKEATRRLAERGDSYGHDKLKGLAEKSEKAHVREFARKLLDAIEKEKK